MMDCPLCMEALEELRLTDGGLGIGRDMVPLLEIDLELVVGNESIKRTKGASQSTMLTLDPEGLRNSSDRRERNSSKD